MSDPVAQIKSLRSQHSVVNTLLPGEEMQGFVSSVENLAESVSPLIEVTRSDPVTAIKTLSAINPVIVQSLFPGKEK